MEKLLPKDLPPDVIRIVLEEMKDQKALVVSANYAIVRVVNRLDGDSTAQNGSRYAGIFRSNPNGGDIIEQRRCQSDTYVSVWLSENAKMSDHIRQAILTKNKRRGVRIIPT